MGNNFMVFADTDGDVQIPNVGFNDNGVPIFFELETQEIDFGIRSHVKKASDKIVVFADDAEGTEFSAIIDGEEQEIDIGLGLRVNIGENINLEGKLYTFRWSGSSDTVSPIFEGFKLPDITDAGMNHG